MLLAQEAGMTNGDYIFISVNELVDLTAHDPYALWSTGDAKDDLAREAFRSFYEVRSRQFLHNRISIVFRKIFGNVLVTSFPLCLQT